VGARGVRVRSIVLTAVLFLAARFVVSASAQTADDRSLFSANGHLLFSDSFEDGVANWSLHGLNAINQDHNTFLTSEDSGNILVEVKRTLNLSDFILMIQFRLDGGQSLDTWYRSSGTTSLNGYQVIVQRDLKSGDYSVSLNKNNNNVNYQYGSERATLDDIQSGTWHTMTIQGDGVQDRRHAGHKADVLDRR
jgi:hypothetical protein